jgi:iron complex transport system substrate-binding protein
MLSVFVYQLRQRTPELVTILAVIAAIAAIELRHAAIHLSPAAKVWTTNSNASYPRVMYDSEGERLVIDKKPVRIISQTLGSDELLFGVCAGGRLVGASSAALDERYSNVVQQVRLRSLPLVENAEQAVALRPDIVFVASYSSAEQVDLLRATGIGVFRLSNFDRIEGIMGNIRAVGYAVGEDSCARKLVAEMKQRIDAIARRVPTRRRPRVMMYGTAGYTEGANTLIDEVFKVVGARNVAAEHGVVGSTRINAEAITLWQPDYLMIGAAREDFDRVRRAMLADPAIANSPAGRAGRIILIEDRYILCVSQYIVNSIEALAHGLYGNGLAVSPDKTSRGG